MTHRGVGLSYFAAADIGVVWHGACSLRRVHDVCSEPRLKRNLVMKLGQVLPQTHRFITHWYLYKFWLLGIHNVHCMFRDLPLLTDSLWLLPSLIQPGVEEGGVYGRCGQTDTRS